MPSYNLTDDTGVMMSASIILLGLALGLPHLDFGMFGFDFSEMPTTVISILRIGIILLAVSIGLKPVEANSERNLRL